MGDFFLGALIGGGVSFAALQINNSLASQCQGAQMSATLVAQLKAGPSVGSSLPACVTNWPFVIGGGVAGLVIAGIFFGTDGIWGAVVADGVLVGLAVMVGEAIS
jgi:membrane protease YdiL (CAAX protease family)